MSMEMDKEITDYSAAVYLKNGLNFSQKDIQECSEKSIAELAPDWTTPYIAILNGEAVLRKDWDLVIQKGQIVVFADVAGIPQGSGSSNPLQMVMMLVVVAISIWAPYTAPFMAAGMGAGTVGGAMASFAIMAAGSMLWKC